MNRRRSPQDHRIGRSTCCLGLLHSIRAAPGLSYHARRPESYSAPQVWYAQTLTHNVGLNVLPSIRVAKARLTAFKLMVSHFANETGYARSDRNL